jgi:hypothetical protein
MQNFTDAEWRPPEGEVFEDDAGRSFGRCFYRIYTELSVSRRAARGTSGLLAALLMSAPDPNRSSATNRSRTVSVSPSAVAHVFRRVSTVEEFLIT